MRVSLANLLIIGGTLALALLVTLLGARVVRWRRDVALRRHAAPVLVVPLSQPPAGMRPPPAREIFHEQAVLPQRRSPATVRSVPPTGASPNRPAPHEPEADLLYVSDTELTGRPTQAVRSLDDAEHDSDDGTEPTPIFEGRKIRFVQAEEGTLEFLPGRLEVVAGEDVGQEIHFARLLGELETTVTFGRSEGPALRHIQLLDPTVSRTHARMSFSGSRWHLHNLSRTNAVILNGAPLPDHGDGITLEDGDRIEMGAVVFVFHAR